MENDNERCDYGDGVNSIQTVLLFVTISPAYIRLKCAAFLCIIQPNEVHFILHRIQFNLRAIHKFVAFSTHFDDVENKAKTHLNT